ncbi:MAG: DUF6884 domain-containing protein [Saprospiraceae bacterium]
MQKIVLVTCVKPKKNYKCAAKDLYQGELFQELMDFANAKNPAKIFILSGKHHLLALNTEIAPYDVNLNHISEKELKAWSAKVLAQLVAKGCDLQNDYFYLLTNETYRRHLVTAIKQYEVPFYIE